MYASALCNRTLTLTRSRPFSALQRVMEMNLNEGSCSTGSQPDRGMKRPYQATGDPSAHPMRSGAGMQGMCGPARTLKV